MSHRADESFFDAKLTWSERKDRILGSYLVAYLPKIATQGKPVLLVDGFAGKGKFEDGSPGSPLIMLEAVRSYPSARARILAIEANKNLFARLSEVVRGFPEIQAVNDRFLNRLAEIEAAASTHSVFLYLDPFTAKGLDLVQLERVFSWLSRRQSIEVLVNFQAPIFARWALKALGRSIASEPSEEIPTTPETRELDGIVGGDWWRDPASKASEFDALVRAVVDGYCRRLRCAFAEVCFHEVFARSTHEVPKYVLVFGSRHPDALLLMNDEMVKSGHSLRKEELAESVQPGLFDRIDQAPIEHAHRLPRIVLEALDKRMARGMLILTIIRRHFGIFLRKEVRGVIEKLIHEGRVRTATGKPRINDDVEIWRTE